jgi:hypothetical protein
MIFTASMVQKLIIYEKTIKLLLVNQIFFFNTVKTCFHQQNIENNIRL